MLLVNQCIYPKNAPEIHFTDASFKISKGIVNNLLQLKLKL